MLPPQSSVTPRQTTLPNLDRTGRWREHLEQVILPWWETHAIDQTGGVFTCFDNAGTLLSRQKYTWSQGRWAWMSAELAAEAWAGRLSINADQWANRSRQTARFLLNHTVLDDHTTAFRVDAAGRPIPNEAHGQIATSVFADLFVVLGLAGAIRCATDSAESNRWEQIALDILTTAETSIGNQTAPTDPYPVPEGFTDLAGPMNLLHASSELLRARYSDVAARVHDRARDTLVTDYMDESWWWEFRPGVHELESTLLARHRTPGHLLELIWMLIHSDAERASPGEAGPAEIPLAHLTQLADRALKIGWDTEYGGILRYSDHLGGQPAGPHLKAEQPAPYEDLIETTWDTKLWWVHAEAIYTTTLLHSLGSTTMGQHADRIATYTFDTFPDHKHGEWLQIRSRDGSPLDQVVALPVKDPMHIARSLIMLNRLESSTRNPNGDR